MIIDFKLIKKHIIKNKCIFCKKELTKVEIKLFNCENCQINCHIFAISYGIYAINESKCGAMIWDDGAVMWRGTATIIRDKVIASNAKEFLELCSKRKDIVNLLK